MKKRSRRTSKRARSITFEMAVTMAVLITGTVLLCWLLNTFLLGSYYTTHKQKSISGAYDMISSASGNDELNSEDFDVALEKICANDNIALMIISSDGSIIKSSTNNSEDLRTQFLDAIFITGNAPVLYQGDNYVIKRQTDSRLDSDYLVLWGTLPDGNFIMMRSALESIKESASISNRFMLFAGGVAVILSIIVAYFVTRRFTRPVVALTEISKRMAALDFEAKYEGHSSCEVDELGENMNNLSRNLERTISELKSANNELKLDNERKTEIDEMRKEFLSNVSHELKTPLALIQGYAEGLQECINDDPESRDFYCDVIMDETDKMNRMVKKLLTLNQLEFGNDTVTMERFDITELIQGIITSSGLMLKQNGITLSFDDSRPIYVWADEFKVEEVITNYVSNAIHYAMDEKKIEIFYTIKEDCVRISVFNTGKQIPEEDLDKVWIKFYKVDKARTREYGGSGIGLSIVKAIMDSFHRECGVINHENGVEFWLELDTNNNSVA